MNSLSVPVVAASGVSARHDGLLMLDAVDLEIAPQSIVLLVGADGSGKTALLRTLIGVERASAGVIRLFGGADRDLAEGRARSAYIASTVHGLARRLSVSQLMRYHAAYARAWDREFAFDLARRFALSDVQPIIEMSASRQSLTSVLMALAQRPEFLLWDNPRPPYDDATRAVVMSVVRDYVHSAGATLLLAATNVPPEIEDVVDRVVILHHGRVFVSENTAALCDAFRWYHLLRHAADEARANVTLPILLESPGGRETKWLIPGDEAAVLAQLEKSGLAVANVSAVSLPDAVRAHRTKLEPRA